MRAKHDHVEDDLLLQAPLVLGKGSLVSTPAASHTHMYYHANCDSLVDRPVLVQGFPDLDIDCAHTELNITRHTSMRALSQQP